MKDRPYIGINNFNFSVPLLLPRKNKTKQRGRQRTVTIMHSNTKLEYRENKTSSHLNYTLEEKLFKIFPPPSSSPTLSTPCNVLSLISYFNISQLFQQVGKLSE